MAAKKKRIITQRMHVSVFWAGFVLFCAVLGRIYVARLIGNGACKEKPATIIIFKQDAQPLYFYFILFLYHQSFLLFLPFSFFFTAFLQ